MAPDRREFLKLAGGAFLVGGACAPDLHWRAARDLVRHGNLGRVVFCRVSHRTVREAVESLRFLFDGATPISGSEPTLRYRDFVAAYEKANLSDHHQLVVCGTEATLVVDRRGYRRFA
jgi:hypothetical protein